MRGLRGIRKRKKKPGEGGRRVINHDEPVLGICYLIDIFYFFVIPSIFLLPPLIPRLIIPKKNQISPAITSYESENRFFLKKRISLFFLEKKLFILGFFKKRIISYVLYITLCWLLVLIL